ncbi:hypothetical protein L596_004885 [Steinernema carpocapsae]|uniref:Uncharacterized protein n=1 Tax=Steinernema carpocapsae TaxID=34508 RepID=A0A4U8UXG1_STECR|nr:hypothetical protein L596_004885 [Steinernema carpocapsae]
MLEYRFCFVCYFCCPRRGYHPITSALVLRDQHVQAAEAAVSREGASGDDNHVDQHPHAPHVCLDEHTTRTGEVPATLEGQLAESAKSN